MESLVTLIRKEIKNILILFEYLIWLLLDPSKFTKINKKEIKKVLIINTGSIGEIIANTPLLPALKNKLNCEISFMIHKGYGAVFENNPYVSEIIEYEENFKKNIKKLRKDNFDLAIIIFPPSLKISLMCLFSGIKYRIGCYKGIKEGPSFFFTKRTFPINNKNVVEKYLDIIKQIGINNPDPRTEIYLSDREKNNLKNKLRKLKIKDFIIVHPGFKSILEYEYPSRLWPLERYAEVIDYLIEKYKIKILLTGSRNEEPVSNKIKSLVKKENKKNVIICAKKFGFRESFVLIDFAKLIIEPSTGAGHCIATPLKTPVIDLMGKMDVHEWRPWGDKDKIRYFFHNEVCTGCNLEFCRKKTIECLKAITVKEVINAADELLKKDLKRQ